MSKARESRSPCSLSLKKISSMGSILSYTRAGALALRVTGRKVKKRAAGSAGILEASSRRSSTIKAALNTGGLSPGLTLVYLKSGAPLKRVSAMALGEPGI